MTLGNFHGPVTHLNNFIKLHVNLYFLPQITSLAQMPTPTQLARLVTLNVILVLQFRGRLGSIIANRESVLLLSACFACRLLSDNEILFPLKFYENLKAVDGSILICVSVTKFIYFNCFLKEVPSSNIKCSSFYCLFLSAFTNY